MEEKKKWTEANRFIDYNLNFLLFAFYGKNILL